MYNDALGEYQMWYTGQSSTQSWIGYATSPDGVTWTRYSTDPVLSPDVSWEGPAVMNPSVIWNASLSEYQMWYAAGAQYEPIAIGYATSSDGEHWTKSSSNPVFGAGTSGSWDQSQVGGPDVILLPDGYYYLFYIGYADINTTAIGIARSANGQTGWERMPTNPIISPTAGTWDCDADYKPSVVWEAATQEWMLWFNGRCGSPEQQGLAIHPGLSLGF